MNKKFLIFLLTIFSCLPICGQDFLHYKISETVRFKVGTDAISSTDTTYKRLVEKVVPYIKEHSEEVDSILVIGCSSPEGGKTRNINLARQRAAKVANLFKELPETKITKKYITGDYFSLFYYKGNGTIQNEWPILRSASVEIYLTHRCQQDTVAIITPAPEADTVLVYVRDTVATGNILVGNQQGLTEDYGSFLIGTDLAPDLLTIPSVVAMFFPFDGKFAISGEFNYANWMLFKKRLSVVNVYLDLKEYFKEPGKGWFIGAYGNVGFLDVEIGKGINGATFGFGITTGYAFTKGRIRIEPFVRLGWTGVDGEDTVITGVPTIITATGDKATITVEYQDKVRSGDYAIIGLTGLGVNIMYEFRWRRK